MVTFLLGSGSDLLVVWTSNPCRKKRISDLVSKQILQPEWSGGSSLRCSDEDLWTFPFCLGVRWLPEPGGDRLGSIIGCSVPEPDMLLVIDGVQEHRQQVDRGPSSHWFRLASWGPEPSCNLLQRFWRSSRCSGSEQEHLFN